MVAAGGYELPFSGYEPHPDIPGAYNFTPSGGGAPILAAGDEAERMRSLLDRTKPPDTRTADASWSAVGGALGGDPSLAKPQAAPTQSDASGAMQVAGRAMGGGSNGVQAPGTPAGAPTPQAPETPPQGPAALPPPQAAGGPQAAAPTLPNGGLDLDKAIRVTHSKAGYIPTSQSLETKGGVQDPALREEMLKNYGEQATAMRASHDLEQQALQAQVGANALAYKQADTKALELEKQQADRLAKDQLGAQEYTRISDHIARDRDAIANKEVDPGRIFRGKPLAQVNAALAAALGAFGSAFTHGPNFALDIINKKIDDDIQAQREQIQRGVNAKDNDLARIRDKYNVSTQVAEKIYALQATQYTQALARKQAAQIGGQQAQMQLAGLDEAFAAKQGALLKDLNSTVMGEVKSSQSARWNPGGTSVSLDPVFKARGQAMEVAGKAAVDQYKAEHGGQAPPKAGAGSGGKESPRIATQEATSESAIQDIDNIRKELPTGFIAPDLPGLPRTEARIALDSKVNAVVGKLVAAMNGTMNEHEMEMLRNEARSPREAVRNAALEEIRRAVTTQHAALGRAAERSRGGTSTAAESAAEDQAP